MKHSTPGIGLGVGAVALNTCPSTDESIFCQFSRFFQVVMMIFTLAILAYFVYTYATPYLFKKGRR
jgi:hypothetical protein